MNVRNWQHARLLLSPDDGGGSGDNSSSNNSLPDAVAKAFEKLVERNGGNVDSVAMMLYDENKRHRDTIRDLRAKVPTEGSVTLTADEAKAWEAYKALGTPEETKKAVDERTQLQGKLDGLERDSMLRAVADAAGYKFSVLSDRDKVARLDGKTLQYEVKEVERDGTKVKVAFVKDGQTEKPLSDYATEQWSEFLPALVANNTQQQQQSGTPFPRQYAGTGGNSKPTDFVATFQAEQEERAKAVKNPLMRD